MLEIRNAIHGSILLTLSLAACGDDSPGQVLGMDGGSHDDGGTHDAGALPDGGSRF